MTPNVRDFPALIRWLADTYHAGHFYPIAAHIGRSPALIDQWKRGVVKNPTIGSLRKLAEAYDLDLTAVIRLATTAPPRPRKPAPIAGGSGAANPLPAAPLSDGEGALCQFRRWVVRQVVAFAPMPPTPRAA